MAEKNSGKRSGFVTYSYFKVRHLEQFEMMESVCERDTVSQKNVYNTKGISFL